MPLTSQQCSLIKKFLEVLFDPGEGICVSENAFGRSVIPVENVDPVDLSHQRLQYFSINPMVDRRLDANVTAYRNILLENDEIPVMDQVKIIEELKLPYSAATFSGNKSIHFIVSLQTPLPDRKMYDFVVGWIQNVLAPYRFDPKTKNPSRFSRMPGGTNVKFNDEGVCYHSKVQVPLKVSQRITEDQIENWLLRFPECKPEKPVHDPTVPLSDTAQPMYLSQWTNYLLEQGIYAGKRNDQYFNMAFDFMEAGFSCDEAINYVLQNAKHVGDFPIREIESTFRSAYKRNSGGR